MISPNDTIFRLSEPTKSLCWEILLAVPLFKFFGREIRIVSRLFRQSLLRLQLWHITVYTTAPVLIIVPVNWGLYFFGGAFSYGLAHRLASFENTTTRLLALWWQALRCEFDLSDLLKTGCTLFGWVWLLLSNIVVDFSLFRAWICTEIRVLFLRGGHDLMLLGLNLVVVVELIQLTFEEAFVWADNNRHWLRACHYFCLNRTLRIVQRFLVCYYVRWHLLVGWEKFFLTFLSLPTDGLLHLLS